MDEKERKALEDLRGFIEWALEEEQDFHSVCVTLAHDVNIFIESIVKGRWLGLPRSSGWKKELIEVETGDDDDQD